MDPFHVVSLAARKLDQCRRRIQRAITGRRGRAGDRLYRARRTLLTGAGLLTDAQTERLETLFADERHAAVQASWGVYQRLIQAYRTEEAGLGKYLTQRLISSLKQAIPEGLEEIQTLARTLISRSQDVLAYFDRPRTSNGPTPGHQRTPGAPTRNHPGLPQPGQLHHPQPHPHRPPQRPPDNNHLNQPTSPTYHTLKHEEPTNPPGQRYDKPALNENDLIERYVERGLIITNQNPAARYLRYIGYYRPTPITHRSGSSPPAPPVLHMA